VHRSPSRAREGREHEHPAAGPHAVTSGFANLSQPADRTAPAPGDAYMSLDRPSPQDVLAKARLKLLQQLEHWLDTRNGTPLTEHATARRGRHRRTRWTSTSGSGWRVPSPLPFFSPCRC
jgi:hypothetical protein